MRHPEHIVLYNKGAQTVSTVAYDRDGRAILPSSVAFDIVALTKHEDASDRKFTSAGVGTRDTYSKTTDAAAGRGAADRKRIQLSAAHESPTLGKRYLISDTENSEVFILDRLDSSNNDLYALDDLQHKYASGATVSGIEVSASVPATLTDEEDEIQIRWHYAVDWTFNGVIGATGTDPSYVREIIRLERHRLTIPLAPQDLLRKWQALKDVGARFDLRTACIDAVDHVRSECIKQGEWPDERMLGYCGHEAAKYYALMNLALQIGPEVSEQMDAYKGSYHHWLTSMFTGRDKPGIIQARRTDDAAAPGISEHHSSRFGRA